MSITTYCGKGEEGAFCYFPSPTPYLRKDNADDPCLRVTPGSVGTTVYTGERNGYDDSDFYAIFYNAATDRFEESVYASTRGWTYTAGAVVDATPEIYALWEQHKKRDQRNAKARWLKEEKKNRSARAHKCSLSIKDVEALATAFPEKAVRDGVFDLLKTKKFRNEFRAKLAQQVRDWLATPASDRQYGAPLSPKQAQCVLPYKSPYSNRYGLPLFVSRY